MFGLRKGPTRPLAHADGCKILRADPGVRIEWSEVETGHWVAICLCEEEHYREPVADHRARLDPRDPSTGRHAGHAEFASEPDPAVLQVILKVKDSLGKSCWWEECGACDTACRVPHYAASVG